mgnify:CR=1 FL=1
MHRIEATGRAGPLRTDLDGTTPANDSNVPSTEQSKGITAVTIGKHSAAQGVLPLSQFTTAAPAKRTPCTDCGVSRTTGPARCGEARQFIRHDDSALETRVHGRARDPGRTDGQFFGLFRRMLRIAPCGAPTYPENQPARQMKGRKFAAMSVLFSPLTVIFAGAAA